ELEQFNWVRPKWSADKLIAASPFRYDKTPSFFVNFTGEYAGCWGDSGAYDAEWESGNFTKLLSFLRNETYEETEEYLAAEYGVPLDGTDSVKLKPINLRLQRSRQSLNAGILAQYTEDYTYLTSRGISERVQRQMGVLYAPDSKAAVIPWRLPNGHLANVKYRKTFGKTFWYERGGWPIRELVYGIEMAQPITVICEAEIDALSWQTAGVASIAVGGASFNGWKRDLILRSPIEELVIATDNDKAGGKLRREIETMMRGHVRIRQAYVRADCKDANEALVKYGVGALREAIDLAESSQQLYVNLRTSGRGR
ncbi:MAG: toprim domain-containing protein, partial [Bacillus sp. (in: firmicutes)]